MRPSWSFEYPRYLSSKKEIDDRALNREVWKTLASALEPGGERKPVRVLEPGAGVGTMIERTIDWGLFDRAEYTAVDLMERNIRAARSELSDWAAERGFVLTWDGESQAFLHTDRGRVSASLVIDDIHMFLSQPAGCKSWDLIIAHAFMDIVDVRAILSRFYEVLRPGGLLYLSLNYDGETLFLPVIDERLDSRIISLYHENMDQRRVHGDLTGGSRAGRLVLRELQRCGAKILAVGSSDWRVLPTGATYPGDEAYFLHCIVETVSRALWGHRELNRQEFGKWIESRHHQIDHGEMIYIAKQVDILAAAPESGHKRERGTGGVKGKILEESRG